MDNRLMMAVRRLLAGDCREVLPRLPADSVHCVVTSPPYYGLRDYGTAEWEGGDAACDHGGGYRKRRNEQRGGDCGDGGIRRSERDPQTAVCRCGARRIDRQMGLEQTPDEYIAGMVAVFREVRRVLRPDGVCFVNMGDSYNANQGKGWTPTGGLNANASPKVSSGGLAPKQLLMMPARLALALQADGWWLRSQIVWSKPNPMPESVRDRPTNAHEMVYMLTKSARYFFDAEAVRETAEYGYSQEVGADMWQRAGGRTPGSRVVPGNGGTRNIRNVWTIPTHSFRGAHFATFPPDLVERCIKAGTSERGCCAACGAPWRRVVERKKYGDKAGDRSQENGFTRNAMGGQQEWDNYVPPTTTGWRASCKHAGEPIPCTVLDPFAGAGTTLLVADRLQRNGIGIDLNPAYTRMALRRIRDDASLFDWFQPEPEVPDALGDLFDVAPTAAETV